MKKIVVTLLALVTLHGWADMSLPECKKVSEAIVKLQNAIVKRAYEQLKRGAWATYSNGTTAVYVGKTTRDGITLYGIDMTHPNLQIWYRIVPKTFHLAGRSFTLLTLDPYDLYFQTKNGVRFVDHSMLDAFVKMRGERLSMILTPAHIWFPPRCEYEVSLTTKPYRLPNGQTIEATRIRSLENGAWVTASAEVPFGYVDDGTPKKGIGTRLVDFGYQGGHPAITDKARTHAQPMPPIPVLPGGAPMPIVPGIIGGPR